jgi:hypothetical protein
VISPASTLRKAGLRQILTLLLDFRMLPTMKTMLASVIAPSSGCATTKQLAPLLVAALTASLALVSCSDKKENKHSLQSQTSLDIGSGALPADSSSQGEVLARDWRSDWALFIAAIAPYIRQSWMLESESESFLGQSVIWEGKVLSVDLQVDSASVSISMPPVSVTLPDGTTNTLDSLTLRPKSDNVAGWRRVNTNDTIRFKTTIGTVGNDGKRIPVVFFLMQGVPGTELAESLKVLLMTDDGELVGNRGSKSQRASR